MIVYTRHTSSCMCVGFPRSPQSLTRVSSWGFTASPPSCNSNYLGYRREQSYLFAKRGVMNVSLWSSKNLLSPEGREPPHIRAIKKADFHPPCRFVKRFTPTLYRYSPRPAAWAPAPSAYCRYGSPAADRCGSYRYPPLRTYSRRISPHRSAWEFYVA